MQTVKDAHNASVLCLQFDEDTGFMITGGSDQKVIVWEEMGQYPVSFFLKDRALTATCIDSVRCLLPSRRRHSDQAA
jgi:WD40 repeat protein